MSKKGLPGERPRAGEKRKNIINMKSQLHLTLSQHFLACKRPSYLVLDVPHNFPYFHLSVPLFSTTLDALFFPSRISRLDSRFHAHTVETHQRRTKTPARRQQQTTEAIIVLTIKKNFT
jgi:hypothetical protein